MKRKVQHAEEKKPAPGETEPGPKAPEELLWRAAEFEHTAKEAGWFWMIGTASVILALVGLWQKNFFFALFILAAGALLLFFGKRTPRVVDFSITARGVGIGRDIFYEYGALEGFDVLTRPGGLDHVVLRRRSFADPYLRLPIDSVLAVRAEALLAKKLPRMQYQETFVDLFAEWLGF